MTKKTERPQENSEAQETDDLERALEQELKQAAESDESAQKQAQDQPKEKDTQDTKDKKIEELTRNLQRLQAEFDNYQKRITKEKEEFKDYATAMFIKDMLPYLDTFELALKSKNSHEQFAKGMEMLYQQMMQFLIQKGLRTILAANQQFDPHKHEALLQETSSKPHGTVLEVLQRGYTFKEKVLRNARVKISSGPAQKKEETDDNKGDTTTKNP